MGKSKIVIIVLGFTSLILITGALFQSSSKLVENNGHFYIKNISQKAYADDNDDDDDDDEEIEEYNIDADKKHD